MRRQLRRIFLLAIASVVIGCGLAQATTLTISVKDDAWPLEASTAYYVPGTELNLDAIDWTGGWIGSVEDSAPADFRIVIYNDSNNGPGVC